MVGSIVDFCGCGLPRVRKTCRPSYNACALRRRILPDSVREERVELPKWCVLACAWLGCARGHVPCRSRNVSAMWVRASLDAHHHQQQLAATSDVGRHAQEPRTTLRFFSHVQQGGFAHTYNMISNSPRADALRLNVCVSTCWRDHWTQVFRGVHTVLSRRTKEESFDPLENCSFLVSCGGT